MANPSDQLTAARDAALTAIGAGDWATVVMECTKAEMILATIPDSRIGNMSDLEWDRAAITRLRQRAEELLGDGDGCALTVCQVEYTGNMSSGGCGCSAS